MTRRKPLIAANWKMHPPPPGFESANSPYQTRKDIDVFVFPTHLDLERCIEAGLRTGAQWGHPEASGAHTGDVSMAMLRSLGCAAVLCGHSERRRDHGETDALVAAQAKTALALGLPPVVCIGESESERKKGLATTVAQRQVGWILEKCSLNNHTSEGAGLVGPAPGAHHKEKEWSTEGKPLGLLSVIFAYEPVWAIGTGVTPTAEEAQYMHSFIRSLLPPEIQETTRILYGGSLNAANANALLSQPDIDGGLIGGASLKIDEFHQIVEIASALSRSQK